ncbi:hypothetical protein EJB05_56440, partial [Eragrostis curvula]
MAPVAPSSATASTGQASAQYMVLRLCADLCWYPFVEGRLSFSREYAWVTYFSGVAPSMCLVEKQ